MQKVKQCLQKNSLKKYLNLEALFACIFSFSMNATPFKNVQKLITPEIFPILYVMYSINLK